MPNPIRIQRKNLILTEGEDEKYFFWYLLENYKIEDIDVHNYGGISDLTGYLRTLQKVDNYNAVKTVLIARDAENSAISAIQSVNASLKKSGLITKDTEDIPPFKIINQVKKIGIMTFPGIDESGKIIETGTLEDLCLKLFKEQTIMTKTDAYILDYQNNGYAFVRSHKNRLHAALSFTNEYVGLKIGETAKAQGFDFSSPSLKPFLDVIRQVDGVDES
jgi:hypothetical protein